jgi:hypothetical protein
MLLSKSKMDAESMAAAPFKKMIQIAGRSGTGDMGARTGEETAGGKGLLL